MAVAKAGWGALIRRRLPPVARRRARSRVRRSRAEVLPQLRATEKDAAEAGTAAVEAEGDTATDQTSPEAITEVYVCLDCGFIIREGGAKV